MSNDTFFESPSEQSLVKSTIVSKYFWSWANVVMSTAKKNNKPIQYIDLFAGPGRYEDNTQSTPLLILKKAIQDTEMSKMLKVILNDGNPNYASSLQSAINEMDGIKTLAYEPVIYNDTVDNRFVQMFNQRNLPPTLTFLDPFGYMGLSRGLVNSVLKDWGCDCIFFFNYNRINMGINNPFVETHMNGLFGEVRANALRQTLQNMPPSERELTIVEAIAQTLKDLGGKYVLPFCFKNKKGVRTSHHLIFVSKHIKGYLIMKDIMANASSEYEQGVPSFSYCPPTNKVEQALLFSLSHPLEDLEEMLLTEYEGRTVTIKELFEEHNVDKRYIRKNYAEILLKMEQEEKIITDPKKRRPNTFGDNVKISFPRRNK